MYDYYGEFLKDYNQVKGYYEAFSRNIGWMKPPDAHSAWKIYLQAKAQYNKLMVMGRTCVGETGREPAMFGNAITWAEHSNFGVITHNDEQEYVLNGSVGIYEQNGIIRNHTTLHPIHVANSGSILHFYTPNNAFRGYHFLYNDAWLLGGAHGQCEFSLASPRRRDNIWDGNFNRLTATGREVAFLMGCGAYQARRYGDHEAFVVIDKFRARTTSFPGLVQTVTAVNAANVHNLFLPVPQICTGGNDVGMTGRVNRLRDLLKDRYNL